MHMNWFQVAKVCYVPDCSVDGMNERMCVVYFKLCFMIGYVVKWCAFMSYNNNNNNNNTWCYQLYVFIFITKLYIITSCHMYLHYIRIIIFIFHQ